MTSPRASPERKFGHRLAYSRQLDSVYFQNEQLIGAGAASTKMAHHIFFCPVVCYATLVGLLSFGVASDARVLNGTLSPGAVLTVCTSPFDPYVQCTPGLVPTDASGERLKLCPPSLLFPDYHRPFNVSGSFIGFSIAAASLRSRMICT